MRTFQRVRAGQVACGWMAAIALCAGVAGCGGGGGGGGAQSEDLLALVPSAGSLSPSFDPDVLAYDVEVGAFAPSATLTPFAADAASSVTVNGVPVESGIASDPIPLDFGPNPVTVEVTAADGAEKAYAVVFVRAPEPAPEAYFKASNTDPADRFGSSVALSGDTLVVGAPEEDGAATGVDGDESDDSASNAGAAYVFVRAGDSWVQQAYLKASNADAEDLFGGAVAISGDTIVVGARGEDSAARGVNGDPTDDSAGSAGAAYVFVRSGNVWTQQAYLKGSDTERADRFGAGVAVSGDTIVVGAPFEAGSEGAAYVFVRDGTAWSEQALLEAAVPDSFDLFGESVGISGDTIVVGARGEDGSATGVGGDETDDSLESAGAAYVFVRSGTVWAQQAYLKASNTDPGDLFGKSVAISGDTVVVGAPGESSDARGVDGDQTRDSAFEAGAAYVFVRSGSAWTQQAYLKASNTDSFDAFGTSVAVSGDVLVVGAPFEDGDGTGLDGDGSDDSEASAGAAYVFARTGVTWAQAAYAKAFETDANDAFGTSVTASGDSVVAGAPDEDGSATGVGAPADDAAFEAGAAYSFR